MDLAARKRRLLTGAIALAVLVLVAVVAGGRARRRAAPAQRHAPIEALDALQAAVDRLAIVRAELRPARLGLDVPGDGTPLAEALAAVTAAAQPAIDAGGAEAASALVREARRLQADGAVDLALANGERALAVRLAAELTGADAPAVQAVVAAHADPAAAAPLLAALPPEPQPSALDVQPEELVWAKARAELWSQRLSLGQPPTSLGQRPEPTSLGQPPTYLGQPPTYLGQPPTSLGQPAWDRLAGEALALSATDPVQAAAELGRASPDRAAGLAAGVAGVLLDGPGRAVPTGDELLSALVRLRALSPRATTRATLARPLRRLAEATVGDAAARGDLAALVSASLAVQLAAEHAPEAVTLVGPCHAPLLRLAEQVAPASPERLLAAVALLRLGDLLPPGALVTSGADAPSVAADDDPAARVVLALLRARRAVAPADWRAVVAEVERALEGAPPTARAALLQARAEARDALGDAEAARGDLEVARGLSSRPAVILDRLALWHLERGPPESGPATAATLLILASAEADDAPAWPPAWPPALDPTPAWRHRRLALDDRGRGALDERLRALAASLRQAGADALADEVEAGMR